MLRAMPMPDVIVRFRRAHAARVTRATEGRARVSMGVALAAQLTPVVFVVVDCGQPAAVPNGKTKVSDTSWKSVASYTCDTGFVLQGASSRQCMSTGEQQLSLCWCVSVF